MTILRDPLWQFVGVAIAVLAVLVSIALTLIQRRRKRLGYKLLTDTPVLSVREELQGRIKVLLDEQPVQDLSLIVIRLVNRGNLPIRSNEYERSLNFVFSNEATLISAEITDQQPTNLGAQVEIAATNRVELKPVLLNPRDSITLKCLVTGSKEIVCDARIVGVGAVEALSTDDSPYRTVTSILGLFLAIAGMYGGIRYSRSAAPIPPPEPAEIISMVVFMIGVLLVTIPVMPGIVRSLRRALRGDGNGHSRDAG